MILNIPSLQLIPVNMIAYRSQYGSANPTAIIAPAIAATLMSTLVAVGMLRASGFFDMLGTLLGPLTAAVGLPAQLMPLLVVKLFSSSAATGLLTSILMNCTETVFYSMSDSGGEGDEDEVYFDRDSGECSFSADDDLI